MSSLRCNRCGQEIHSKKDLTIGFHYYFYSTIRPYHKKCFTERHNKEKLAPTATINPNNLKVQKVFGYFFIGVIIAIITYGMFYNYNKQWAWTLPFVAALFSYFPFISLINIRKIEKLR